MMMMPTTKLLTMLADLNSEAFSSVLHTGTYGSLFQMTLQQEETVELRPGEDPRAYCSTLFSFPEQIPGTTNKSSSILCLYRSTVWWMRPSWVSSMAQVPPETVLLLWKDLEVDQYRLLLPVVFPSKKPMDHKQHDQPHDFASSSLRGSGGGTNNQLSLCSNHAATALYEGCAKDPFALIQEGVQMASGVWHRRGGGQRRVRSSSNHHHRHCTPAEKSSSSSSSSPSASVAHIMLHKLGWCTWNAFYVHVTGQGVIEAVDKMQQTHSIPIRWMILDDGWQDTCSSSTGDDVGDEDFQNGEQWSRRLRSLREDPNKFPGTMTLPQTVATLREKLDAVLVWHTLSGYWLGLRPNKSADNTGGKGELPSSRLHFPWFSRGLLDNDPRLCQEASVTRGIGIPDDAVEFYRRYHGEFLSSVCGFDGVKVDAQGVVGTLRTTAPPILPESAAMSSEKSVVLALHTALVDSIQQNFGCVADLCDDITGGDDTPGRTSDLSPIIQCMAHAPEIFYRLPSLYESGDEYIPNAKPFFRASDDFYPENPASHGPQIVACAYNSLIFQHVSLPDWDMFATSMSDENFVRMHAVARCISGGPIYISDAPDSNMNREALDWLCCQDGTTFPCLRTALPTLSSLLQNPLSSDDAGQESTSAFTIWNVNGESSDSVTSGIVGVFYLHGSGHRDTTKLSYVPAKSSHFGNVQALVRPSDVQDFAGERYRRAQFLACSFFFDQAEVLESPHASMTINLSPLQSDAISFYPILKAKTLDFVALGIAGRINGAGAIRSVELVNGEAVAVKVCGCGDFAMAVRRSVATVVGTGSPRPHLTVDGVPTTTYKHYNGEWAASGSPHWQVRRLGFDVLSIDLPPGNDCHKVSVDFRVH